jgi:hypothetical protein
MPNNIIFSLHAYSEAINSSEKVYRKGGALYKKGVLDRKSVNALQEYLCEILY